MAERCWRGECRMKCYYPEACRQAEPKALGRYLNLDTAAEHVGSRVTYWNGRNAEHGVIDRVGDFHVFVLYDGDHGPKATRAEDLRIVGLAATSSAPVPDDDTARPRPVMPVCTDPECTIRRKPGFPMHGPHDFRAAVARPADPDRDGEA